ncbi:hypothetical protein BK648_24760 [Pseudomonas poae]|uniref:Uncharacterized protein n=1 Tax=Pseudomonas poae TaxID=200451 RepID=A0A423ERP3_9PSED|nr:hypothetical protein [Pseudomonas poae]ROM33972.1 hypothetical protein BK648_24760 [Pseudomonas poae]
MRADEIFMADLSGLSWRTQFNVDFLAHLLIFACWIAWRHRFRPVGFALALLCVLGGSVVSLLDLLTISVDARGRVARLLLGARYAEIAMDSENISK